LGYWSLIKNKDGAGVGRKKSGSKTAALQRELSTRLGIANAQERIKKQFGGYQGEALG
jgi:hypothetical protein